MPKIVIWTDEMTDTLVNSVNKIPGTQIARQLNISHTAYRSKLKNLGIKLDAKAKSEFYRANGIKSQEARRAKRKQPFPGASIYTITYFAFIKHRLTRKNSLNNRVKYSLDDLASDILSAFDMRMEDLIGDSKKTKFVHARYIFCLVARRKTTESYVDIAQFLRYRQHGAVTHALKQIQLYKKSNDQVFMNNWLDYLSHTKIYK